jgi:hypothetical protein
LGCRAFAPRVFLVVLSRAAPASLVVRASDVLRELRLDCNACLVDRSSFLRVQLHGETWDFQVQDQLSVCLLHKGTPLAWGDRPHVGPAFTKVPVVITVGRYPRDVTDHVIDRGLAAIWL